MEQEKTTNELDTAAKIFAELYLEAMNKRPMSKLKKTMRNINQFDDTIGPAEAADTVGVREYEIDARKRPNVIIRAKKRIEAWIMTNREPRGGFIPTRTRIYKSKREQIRDKYNKKIAKLTSERDDKLEKLKNIEPRLLERVAKAIFSKKRKMIKLYITKRTDDRLLECMSVHYSQPKGFVGRNICYAITYDNNYYGHIVGGSATMHLVGRDEFFNTDKSKLNNIINNIFFHISPAGGRYPIRNFAQNVIKEWRIQMVKDWTEKYKDHVIGFETLVELPRTGECYLRDGWTLVGQTKGFTCKRTSGKGTDSWSGKRVWDTENLRPKLVFCKKAQ